MSYEYSDESRLPLPDAAQSVGKSPRQIRYLVQTQRLKAIKSGGRWLISQNDLEARCSGHSSYSGLHAAESDRNQTDFFEVDMDRIIDPPVPGSGEEIPLKAQDTLAVDSAIRVHVSRKDGSHLDMIIPQIHDHTAGNIMRAFLGG